MTNKEPKVKYSYSRLTFKRDEIEPLEIHESFLVKTPIGSFQMTKADFYRVFPNVTRSKAYSQNGLFNYPTVPRKALQFLADNNVTNCNVSNKKLAPYALPSFLEGVCTQQIYKRWLQRKAMAHLKRDSKRGMKGISCTLYKQAIHKAVLDGGQFDAYTGEPLDWTLISKYDNEDSKAGKKIYKKKFWKLPTVDHFEADHNSVTFKICSWRLNDCKNDLSLNEFLEVCRKVLEHHQI